MHQKVLTVGKYILAIIVGVMIYEACLKGYAHIRFNRELKELQTSHDYDQLYQIQSTFLHKPAANQIAYAVIGNCGIPGTPEAKLAGLDAIIKNNMTFEPAFSLSGAIVHAPYEGEYIPYEGVYDETKDSMKNIRAQALETYDYFLNRSLLVPCRTITRRLNNEPSLELLQQKISFLARYLFMDEQTLQEQAVREGVESIEPLILERIRQLLPEDIRNAPSQPTNTKEEYEQRLQEMVNKQENR